MAIPTTVFLNGVFLPLSDAKISVLDRGFLFGDSVYEVVPIFAGKPFCAERHFIRLDKSLSFLHMKPVFNETQWSQIIAGLIQHNAFKEDGALYFQITRGASLKGRNFLYSEEELTPTIFAMLSSVELKPDKTVKVFTMHDSRWEHCDIKSNNLLPALLARNSAARQGGDEAILVRDGLVTEGSSSNVFVVKDGLVMTPAGDHRILPGITRDLILEILKNADIPFFEGSVSKEVLYQADEIWLTGSVREMVAVVVLDNIAIGGGSPGPIFNQVCALYEKFKNNQ